MSTSPDVASPYRVMYLMMARRLDRRPAFQRLTRLQKGLVCDHFVRRRLLRIWRQDAIAKGLDPDGIPVPPHIDPEKRCRIFDLQRLLPGARSPERMRSASP